MKKFDIDRKTVTLDKTGIRMVASGTSERTHYLRDAGDGKYVLVSRGPGISGERKVHIANLIMPKSIAEDGNHVYILGQFEDGCYGIVIDHDCEKYDPNRHIFADPQGVITHGTTTYILERCGSYRVRYFLTR